MDEKIHKGRITDWYKYEVGDHGLGYMIQGTFVDHPWFGGEHGHTSYVITHDEATGEIETRNSRYTLIGPETK